MTEYDYSPEAYERALHNHQRVFDWVNNTEQHRTQFGAVEGAQPRPSFFHRLTQRRGSHSYHEPRRRRNSSSSSSSSGSTPVYGMDSRKPGPMPTQAYQSMYVQQQSLSPPSSHRHSKHHHRHHNSHHSSHTSLMYAISPPNSPPVQPYGYQYGTTMSPHAQVISPGAYTYHDKVSGATTFGSPSYFQPTASTGYYPPNSYPFPQTYAQQQQQQPQPSQAAPNGAYGYYYGQAQPPLVSPPTYYPQTAAYPPTIYPLTSYPGVQQQPTRPLLHQRIFSGSSTRKSKKTSRSH